MSMGGGGGSSRTTVEGDPSVRAYTATVLPHLQNFVAQYGPTLPNYMGTYQRQFAGESPLQQIANTQIATGLTQTPQAYSAMMNWGAARASAPHYLGSYASGASYGGPYAGAGAASLPTLQGREVLAAPAPMAPGGLAISSQGVPLANQPAGK